MDTQNTQGVRIAYKLLRIRNDNTLGSLFVGRSRSIPVGEWMDCEYDLPHAGLAHRPGFHCTSSPNAPHIKMKLKNGETRVWCMVSIKDFEELSRPISQGGLWYVAKHMRIDAILKDEVKECSEILKADRDNDIKKVVCISTPKGDGFCLYKRRIEELSHLEED